MNIFAIIKAARGSPVPRRRPDVDRVIPLPWTDTEGQAGREERAAGSPLVRQTAGDPSPELSIFARKSRGSRKADIGRARRLLAADLTYVAHPSFDDSAARDAILAPATGFEGPRAGSNSRGPRC